ncbi:MAG: hypothetical protein ABI972_19925 [Acidobacteriota bacterium]
MKALAILLSLVLASPALAPAAVNRLQSRSAPVSAPAATPAPQPLTEDEANELRQRDEQPGKEVAGGALSNLHLTYIVIALAAAVVVLIAVH